MGEKQSNIWKLQLACMNERCAPLLLPFQGELVEEVYEAVEQQENDLKGAVSNPSERFLACLYRMEIDRVKYLLRFYHRNRLQKIERHVIYLLENDETQKVLSEPEYSYARRYHALVERHMLDSALHRIPENLRSLTLRHEARGFDVGPVQGLSMVPEPDVSMFAFVRIERNVGVVDLLGDTGELDLTEGLVVCAKYEALHGLIQDGDARLI